MQAHEAPQISGIARFFGVIPFLTILSVFSTGLRWNVLLDITGILLPTIVVVVIGCVIMAVVGSFARIGNKISPFVVAAYIIGYLISFAIAYFFFNMYVSSIPQFAAIIMLFIFSIPGIGLLYFVQSRYNKKLHKEYWDNYERNNAK